MEQSNAILNRRPQGTGKFTLFSDLPTEIRDYIWEIALSHERLLKADLSFRAFPGDNILTLHVGGRRTCNNLFLVNQEARRAAKRFYRVQLPCIYVGDNLAIVEKYTHGTFYFNPELDTLMVRGYNSKIGDLARMIFSKDPWKVGLLHLAINMDESNSFHRKIQDLQDDLLPRAIGRLKSITFVSKQFYEPDDISGGGVHYVSPEEHQRDLGAFHPYPVFSTNLEFDRHQSDPRPIEETLRRAYIGRFDPCIELADWFGLFERLGISVDKIDQRFMLCTDIFRDYQGLTLPTTLDEGSRFTAEVLEKSHKWPGVMPTQEEYNQHGRDYEHRFPFHTSKEQAPIQQAFGFWLFPLSCIWPRSNEKIITREGRYYADLSTANPELCLFHLY